MPAPRLVDAPAARIAATLAELAVRGVVALPSAAGLAAWLATAGPCSARRALLVAGGEGPPGLVCWEEQESALEGRVAALPLLHPPPKAGWPLTVEAVAAEARRSGCAVVELSLEADAPPTAAAALAAAGFRRRETALFTLDLHSLQARLERLRHPTLPSGWVLRPPEPEELPALVDLLVAFHRDDGGEPDRRWLVRHLAELPPECRRHLVLAAAGELVGTVAVALEQALDGARQGVISDTYLAPAERRRGAGGALFAELLRRFEAQGVAVACGWVEARNIAARRFWQARAVEQPIASWALRL